MINNFFIDNDVKIMLTIIIFILIIYSIFNYYKKNTKKNMQPNIEKSDIVELFYSSSCGHCTQFKPEWNKIKNTNYCIFKEYNCQNGECSSDIKFVPTLKINNNQYHGDMNYNSIMTYLKNQ